MECLLVFFALLVFVTLSIRAAAGGGSGSQRRRSYQQAARQFAGHYTPGGLFGQPTVRFRYGETIAVLTESSSRGLHSGRCTQLQINWSDAHFRAEIASQPMTKYQAEYDALQRVETDDPEFDRRFVVRSTDEEEVHRFLSDGVRWQLVRLLESLSGEFFYVSIGRGRICIRKPQPIRSFAVLKAFIQRSLDLYDQAMITRAVGIEFIENGQAITLEHVICKVCGEEIEGHEMVYCQRCKTPHHGECWQYVGACSVYGCLEKNYRLPQAGSAAIRSHGDVATDSKPADQTKGFSS